MYYVAIIPDLIANALDLAKYTIRGLVDTDGSIFTADKPRCPDYPTIELNTVSYNLALQIRKILLDSGFRVANIRRSWSKMSTTWTYKVPLNGIKNVEKWVDEIGFSNPYKLKRATDCLENYYKRKMGQERFELSTLPASAVRTVF